MNPGVAHGRSRWPLAILVIVLVAVACGPSERPVADPPEAGPPSGGDGTVVEYYPDANVREHWRRLARPRPVPRSALPPRHLDVDRFPESLVDRASIVAGGPPPDAISPIDEPMLVPVDQVDWVDPAEAVLALSVEGETHLYPVQIMLWHEIVNDRFGRVPVAVTYCPLCNSAVAFDRRLGDRTLDFGTSGALYQSALVMYDRQTESLWTHFDGRAVVGELVGSMLEVLPVATVSWADAARRWPDALVVDRPGSVRPYGSSPYPSYEDLDEPLPGFFTGEIDPRLPDRTRVVGLRLGGQALAVERSLVEAEGSLTVDVGGSPVRLDHRPGMRSPLDEVDVAAGVDLGSITASTIGAAGAGNQGGEAVPVLDTFWFAWSAYNPDTVVLDRSGSGASSTGS